LQSLKEEEDCLDCEALKGEKMTKLASLGVVLVALALVSAQGFGQESPNEKPTLKVYPADIPLAIDRSAPRYQKDFHFPPDEIKFIGDENGETRVYEDVMARYLSPETIEEVKNRPLKWLIVRNAYQDTRYRQHYQGDVIEYPVIVDMRYVQIDKYTGMQLNGTLQAVYAVTEMNGHSSKNSISKIQQQQDDRASLYVFSFGRTAPARRRRRHLK